MESNEANLRIPAVLMPSYLSVISTEEGKAASKRVRVNCGICKEIRYYSIHRGVTRMGGTVVACEACRHCYQKFKRQPCILRCKDDGSCYVLGDNSKNRCKACWIAYILGRCPVESDLYTHLVNHLPSKLKAKMAAKPPTSEDVPENERGALGLEIMKDKEWVDVTLVPEVKPPAPSSEDEEEDSNIYDQDFEASLDDDKHMEQFEVAQTSDAYDDYASDYPESRDSQLQNISELTREGKENLEQQPVRWWMEPEAVSSTYTVLQNDSSHTYFNMDAGNTMDGLTSLTPMQPAQPTDGFTTLTPMQIAPEHQHHQNGFHDSEIALLGVKQEKCDWQDGESQEAKVFQNFRVKQEFYPQHEQINLHLHPSPYFGHSDVGSQLNFAMFGHEHGLLNGTAGWKVEGHSLDGLNKGSPLQENADVKKKKGRKPKIKLEKNESKPKTKSPSNKKKRPAPILGPDGLPLPKQRKKVVRFDGVPEEEVAKKVLPDHLGPNMEILVIGINPGLIAAHKGHHYAGPGNHFWKCMYLSGLIPEPFTAYDDFRLLEYGIGFTNMVARTTRGSADLSRQEIKEGSKILRLKLKKYKPLVAVFNGKGIYEIYSGKKQFCFGKQPEMVEGTNTYIWVMPSSSARCAQLPRALDKVPFYSALRKFRDYLKGTIKELDDEEVVFSNVKLTNYKSPVKVEPKTEPDEEVSEPAETLKPIRRKLESERTKGHKSSPKKKITSVKTEKLS
ncbi:hypothetical protein OTU49_006456 [Cherax quadricarinatus]|uniref:G/T mismatch-specific thymine DNA glycosylase n=1 Tax=Cherax quadricarinatus TaxID=27406 RepID=A0AAW0X267_CHEQU